MPIERATARVVAMSAMCTAVGAGVPSLYGVQAIGIGITYCVSKTLCKSTYKRT